MVLCCVLPYRGLFVVAWSSLFSWVFVPWLSLVELVALLLWTLLMFLGCRPWCYAGYFLVITGLLLGVACGVLVAAH